MKDKELDVLLPNENITLASGETVTVRPFSFAKLPKVISLINSIGVGIFVLLEAKNGIQIAPTEQGDGTAELEIDDLVINKVNDFVAEHFEEIVDLMGIYCGRPRDFFFNEEKGPNIEEACMIILTIIERHFGFFTKTLLPVLARMKGRAQSPGGTSSAS